LSACKELDKYDLEYVEDPIQRTDSYSLSLIRKQVKTPFATDGDQFASNPRLFAVNAKLDPPAFDIILSSPQYYGGISGARNLASVCEALGLGLSLHTFAAEPPASQAAVLHIAASQPYMAYACDTTYGSTHYLDQCVATEDTAFKIEDGCIKVPNRPGLGFELDEDRMNEYHEVFEQSGGKGLSSNGDPFKPDWVPMIGAQTWISYPINEERYASWIKTSKRLGYSAEKF
jgi:glucarate dehydratase